MKNFSSYEKSSDGNNFFSGFEKKKHSFKDEKIEKRRKI